MTIGDIRIRIENASKMQGSIAWQTTGPKNTNIERHGMLMFGATLVYVQTFEGGGWEAFITASRSNEVTATFKAIIARVEDDESVGAS